MTERVSRKKPTHGVQEWPDRTTIVLVTICTEHRRPWLASEYSHDLLRQIWTDARGWLVGRYLLMPDHMHFFATYGDRDCSLERWIRYWEREFALVHHHIGWRFQPNHWDVRIRDGQHYAERLEYVRQNPVRKGLVTDAELWPYQGIIHEWMYIGP